MFGRLQPRKEIHAKGMRKQRRRKEVTVWEKCRKRQTVSDVSHVLTTVHNRPVAFINKLYAKCSLSPLSMHENTQYTYSQTYPLFPRVDLSSTHINTEKWQNIRLLTQSLVLLINKLRFVVLLFFLKQHTNISLSHTQVYSLQKQSQ